MKRLFVSTVVVAIVVSLGAAVWAANPQNVQVNWHANNWIILYIPSADQNVTLGTVDGSQYDPASGTWTPITDGNDHSAYVINCRIHPFYFRGKRDRIPKCGPHTLSDGGRRAGCLDQP